MGDRTAEMELSHLIPITHFKHGFTTSEHLHHDDRITRVKLDDHALGVHKTTSRTSHKLVSPPPSKRDGEQGGPLPNTAWEAFYPKGSINPNAPLPGGFGFYLSGPTHFADSLKSGATEAVMSYRMMLEEGWEWVKGGKLPGVFGGVGELSYGCTGGRQDNRCKCFNLRPMWRPQSNGELYTYIPLTPGNESHLLAAPPLSRKNADYGFSVGRGSFKLDIAVGKWVTLAFRIKLNDVGQENGEIQLWVDGVSVILVGGLSLRESAEGKIKGMHFQTFFGGHTDDWASPKDQRAWFADVSGVIIR